MSFCFQRDRIFGHYGVSEAMNLADEEWGEQRMMEAVERCEGLCAAETIEQVIRAADDFASGAKQHDDMTLVVLRVHSTSRNT